MKYENFKIRDGGRPPCWNNRFGHNSTAHCPISMKVFSEAAEVPQMLSCGFQIWKLMVYICFCWWRWRDACVMCTRAVPVARAFCSTSTVWAAGCPASRRPPLCEVSLTLGGSSTTDRTATCRVPTHCSALPPTVFAEAFGRCRHWRTLLIASLDFSELFVKRMLAVAYLGFQQGGGEVP